ncbi:MAG: DUF6157 family protein [Planctomycetaceae bacterium]
MYDRNTFILVAPDCHALRGVVPEAKRVPKPFPVVQFEVLSDEPYRFSYAESLCEIHARQNGLGETPFDDDLVKLLLRKHPCPRTSALPKRYGWGIHVDGDGKLALVACDSAEYRRLSRSKPGMLQLVPALRSKRAAR